MINFDDLKMNDRFGSGLHGFVVIKDNKTEKILVQAHNMIVNDGHKIVMAKLIKNFTEIKDKDQNNYADYNLSKICFSKSAEQTSIDNDLSTAKIDLEADSKFSFDIKMARETETGNMIINTDDKYIKIEQDITINDDMISSITASDGIPILNSLGILAKNNSDNYKLFSRITFDAIPLQTGNTFTLSYYIYF